MEREKLVRRLNSVGKEMFVRYYFLFKDYADGKIGKRSAAQKLIDDGVSNEEGASIRLSNAKAIFAEAENCKALGLVQQSQKVPSAIIQAAGEILKVHCR